MFSEILQFSQENTCARVFFLKNLQASGPQACNFIKIETLAHVFSNEFCEISKNTSFTEHLWATVSMLFKNLPFAWDIKMFWSIILEGKLKEPWQNGRQN